MADVVAPMVGKVFQVHVSVGDHVEKDDEVIVLESMKMEIPLTAPEAGTVKEITANLGDFVKEGQVLLLIE